MQHLKTWSLLQKVATGCAILIAGMAATGIFSWLLMHHVIDQSSDVRESFAPQLQRAADIELNVTRASLQLRHAMLARTPQEQAEALSDVMEKKKLIESLLGEMVRAARTDEDRAGVAALPGLMKTFWDTGLENAALVQAGKNAEAFAFLVNRTIGARNALFAPLALEKKRLRVALDSQLQLIATEAARVRTAVALAALALTGGLVGFALYLLGVLKQLGGEPQELKRVADDVADGQLATSIVLKPGDTGSIMAAMQRMRDKLAETVLGVRQSAESVASASSQIASANLDLSSRTEQQASSLEQTAASMEQLGATVRQNADSARQANQLALSSCTVAVQGGEMVQQVVKTMRDINDSSKKIAEITSVIDGIAFQTNILALNAAVEAARAGEQGRGFAVVASEVRSLAQRSADAAREIKALIGNSVQRVDAGCELVDRAGHTMAEIVASIRRVTHIVGEISAASTEQSSAVLQVGQAVTQMDQVTQQNAALVEEGAAAADSLSHQSQQLVRAVAVFRLA